MVGLRWTRWYEPEVREKWARPTRRIQVGRHGHDVEMYNIRVDLVGYTMHTP
jgi:hypothetical protein